MKAALIALFLSVAAGTADAGERNPTHLFNPGNHVDAEGNVRDRRGRKVGHIEEDVNGSHVLRDMEGRHIGSVDRGSQGELVIRDSDGRRQGSLERRP